MVMKEALYYRIFQPSLHAGFINDVLSNIQYPFVCTTEELVYMCRKDDVSGEN